MSRPDPQLPVIAGGFDPEHVAREVAQELRQLFGERLRNVVLYGSWARGDADAESDIDLLVVLDRVDDRWREHQRMNEILDRHWLDNGVVVSVSVVSESDYANAQRPMLIRARIEGRSIA